MKRLLLAALAVLFTGAVSAQEINSLSLAEGITGYDNYPLGLPGFVWWAAAVLIPAAALRIVTRMSLWLKDRLTEPSTFLALSIFVGMSGLFINSLTLDPDPMGQGFLLAASVFALLGLVGKDREGPLL